MRVVNRSSAMALAAVLSFAVPVAHAQTAANLMALQGLAPFSILDKTPMGKAALASNLKVTEAVHNGTAGQTLLTPFGQAQEQALKDAFINIANVTELGDGLGSKLGGAYQALGGCTSADDGVTVSCNFQIPEITALFDATTKLTVTDAAAGKYFFANLTTDGKKTGLSRGRRDYEADWRHHGCFRESL